MNLECKPFLCCDEDGCKMGMHYKCIEYIFGPAELVDKNKTEEKARFLCNEHYPHKCGWCDSSNPIIQCIMCAEEGIKQYLCQECYNRKGEQVCRACDEGDGVSIYSCTDEDDDDWNDGCDEDWHIDDIYGMMNDENASDCIEDVGFPINPATSEDDNTVINLETSAENNNIDDVDFGNFDFSNIDFDSTDFDDVDFNNFNFDDMEDNVFVA